MHKYSKEYYEKNKEHVKAMQRKYRREKGDKIRAQQKERYESKKPTRDALKADVLSYYGNGLLMCVRCGFDDVRALTLDHIQPIGQQKRRITGLNFYRQLQSQGFPTGYQTLCANCQLIKMFEGSEWKINS